MTGSLIAMMCAQGIYTAACNSAVQAGMAQSGMQQYIDQNIRKVTKEGSNLLGKELTTVLAVGIAGHRFNNGREFQKHLRSPISDGLTLGGSKNSGRIELRWNF